jgi:hypothetical protein
MLRKYLSQGLRFTTKSLKNNFKLFSTVPQPTQESGIKKSHGGLKDSDRIFTNVYRDSDPFVEGAIKRVNIIYNRETGIKLKISF